MTATAANSRELAKLRSDVRQLQDTVRLLEEERQRIIQQRRRRLLIVGASLSFLFHFSLMVYLNFIHHGGGGGGGGGGAAAATYQVAILNQQELSELEKTSFDDLPAGPAQLDDSLAGVPSLEATDPDASAATASPGAIPTLGASGDGSGGIPGTGNGNGGGGGGLGLGGGGGGTSFFGIASKGTRFAYIVDISGSMGQDRKLETAMRELARSIDALPDYSYFHILLFSSDFVQPPMQKGWMRAKKSIVRQFIRWLSEVDAGGGTQPRNAFLQVFALDVRPDVLFFMTDGQIEGFTPEELKQLNSRGKKIVVNTIAFGDPSGQEPLKQMAADSGGVYRFVPSGGP